MGHGGGQLLGTAVGVALENQAAIRSAATPAVNAAGGLLQILFRTFWKSIVVGGALLLLWFVAFAFTYILLGTPVLGSPTVMFSFGIFLFVVLPFIICVRESKTVSRKVAAQNRAHRHHAHEAQVAREEAEAEQMALLQAYMAQQQGQQGFQPQFQPQFQQPQFPPAFNRIR